MIQTLIQSSNFNGRYVALKSFKDHTVIGTNILMDIVDIPFKKLHPNDMPCVTSKI